MHSVYAVCIYRVDASIAPHVNTNAFIRFNKGQCSDCRLGWLGLSVPAQNATNCSFSIDRFRCKLWKWESEYKERWMLVVLWMSIIRMRLTTGFTCADWAHLFIKNQHSIMNHPTLCAIQRQLSSQAVSTRNIDLQRLWILPRICKWAVLHFHRSG